MLKKKSAIFSYVFSKFRINLILRNTSKDNSPFIYKNPLGNPLKNL